MVGKGELPQGQSPEQFTDLIEPVTQATSTIPVAQNGVISFIVEYRNDLNGGLQEGFWLKEFGVFAQDGENEILLYYASLGEYPQYVEAYENGKVNIKKYPVSILVTDDIKVNIAYAAMAFVTEERMKEFVEIEALPYLEGVLAESENGILAELEKKANIETVEQALDTKANAQDVEIALNQKADIEVITEELAKKANTETVQQILNQKADAKAIEQALDKKADIEVVQEALDQKANEMEILQKLSEKADKEAMITELAVKADKEEVQTELDKKVDKEEIEEILQQQIDSTNIVLELDKKADKETVAEELAKKADAETMQEELNKKADAETMQVELAKKADAETMQQALDQKSEKEHKHSTDDITSGTLPITNGGTGNTTGNAATATKLQTARTLALSGDVTGSTAFDGSANKTITATLKNSGVTAGTYGALDFMTKNNGTVWVSNNAKWSGVNAKSTWKAKQDCKISFRWKAPSEMGIYDYFNITAAGTQILANKSGSTEQTGTLTATLKAGQTIVFTCKRDDGNNGMDRAEISEVKYGEGTTDPNTIVYESNIKYYFKIESSIYGFYPAIPVPNITVDAKGRITKAQTIYATPAVEPIISNITKSYIDRIMTENDNVTLGYASLNNNTTGDGNTAIGFETLEENTTGRSNIALGEQALNKNTTGSNNTAVGFTVLGRNKTGFNNTAIGNEALICNEDGYYNTAIGNTALFQNKTGTYNTAVGDGALGQLTTYTNCSGLGYNAQVTGSNQVQLGNTSITVYAQKALVVRSDARDKLDIEDSPLGLNFIMKLRPRKYRMNSREAYFEQGKERDFTATNDGSKAGKRPHYGLVAQEVKEAMNELNVDFAGYLDSKIDGGEDVLSLGYAEFIAPMIKAIQQQQKKIETLEKICQKMS